MKPIPSEWLQPGAIVPVTPDVVRELLECVRVAYKAGQETEREACARVCDEQSQLQLDERVMRGIDVCAAAIRAMGQA
jgi:hypothetical protein